MASDEKIKKFAKEICCSLSNIAKTIRSDDIAYRIETDSKESSDPCLESASKAAMWLYGSVFIINTSNDYNNYLKTKKDFSNYIRQMCNCENWLGKPSIFERFFASLSFVVVCTNTVENTSKNMKRYAPTCWEKYFMEHIEEFYSKGGWGELRRLARSYCYVLEFLHSVATNPYPDLLTKASKSVENYVYFMANRKCKIASTFVKSLKIEYGNECKTSATLWIQFIVKNCKEQSFSNSCTQPPKNPSEVTCLMRVLRCLCCPSKLEDRKLDSNLNHELEQKSNKWPISPLDKKQEFSRINTKLCRLLAMLQLFGKQSNDSVSLEQSSISINNRLLGKTAIEIDEVINRLFRVILSSNKDTSTGELRGKCKNKFKKKNSEIPKND